MTDNSKKKINDSVISCISNAYHQAMSEFCANSDWDNDIYNPGRPFTKKIEVRLTRAVMQSLGGICEVKSSKDLNKHQIPISIVSAKKLDSALKSTKNSTGKASRLDGYWAKYDCFWEAKVSKIDLLHGKNGGMSLYDIGQWSKDLTKLHEIGKELPSARLIYSICVVASGIFSHDSWVAQLKKKIIAEVSHDLKRVNPELLERPEPSDLSDPRSYQRAMLLGLLSLDSSEFCIVPADRWAIISVDARSVSERIIHLDLP